MSLFTFIESYSEQIGGQYTNYDHTRSVIVVPLNDGRFQTVLISTEPSNSSGKTRAVFSSKIGNFDPSMNLKELLHAASGFDYSRFILRDDQLKIEASCLADAATEEEVKFMIQEVALAADQYELKLTGKDIH
jgi:hypothetical protein